MSTGLVVFARLDSRRLPGKVLLDLGGRPLLGRVLDRARRTPGVARVVVATSDRAIDTPIAAFAAAEGLDAYRGDAADVAARALGCADRFGFVRFVRVSGDSPFFPPELAARVLDLHERSGSDVATNVHPRSFPAGASVEVIATAALRRAAAAMASAEEREHVTLHFYRNPGAFRIDNVAAGDDRYAGVRLAVDTPADLDRARWIAARLAGRIGRAALDEIAGLARAWDRDAVSGAAHAPSAPSAKAAAR